MAVAFAVAACSAAGPKFSDIRSPAVPENRGRLYILRERQALYSVMPATIDIDGQTIGRLRNGGFLMIDLPPGPKTITATVFVSRVSARFDLAAARTAYLSIRPQPTGLPPPRGAVGLRPAYRMIDEGSLFSITFLDEAAAMVTLAELSLSE